MTTNDTFTNDNDTDNEIIDETAQGTEDAQAPDETTEATKTTEAPDDAQAGKEAAKYRRRLREAEKERDALASTVETLQRQAVEAVAAQTISKPGALWQAGVQLADVLADDGTPDPGKITAACAAASEALGLMPAPRGNHAPIEGQAPRRPGGATTFASAFGPQAGLD